ncbi:LysM peptidoglycan-binding domain-containing protein [Ureibacillus thermosphaericus]|uniref:LysM peptidoglycan-binding domain-containing protein n=1 Tax=Ureibacillus thermosphaericus TaxID=51173 RepID=UPI0015590808|nr:LysM peptidoglycan-binding domain-containing protein [Ureibacillus thermosphaericus]
MRIHVVQQGDTIWKLASIYHTSMNAIIQLNQLPNPRELLIGQAIVIPDTTTPHIIQFGETLWSIASNYEVSVQAIQQANPTINPYNLIPGTTIYIPPRLHLVQPGESMWQIAAYYGTTAESIIKQNGLRNPDNIYPGMVLIIPRPKPSIEINAYSYQQDEEGAESVNAVGNLLTYFTPFSYMIKEDGTLEPFADELMLNAAKSQQAIPMLAISNFSSTSTGSNLAHVVLSNQELREKLINSCLQVMEEKGYRGLNIDFEYVLPEDRENYNEFLQLTVNRLHERGYFVSTAVAPKTSDEQEGLLYTAHDYEAHGRLVDFVILMTYEWGWRGGPPRAISPINQIRRVVEYALTVIPAQKIFLGFQIYARDWKIPHVEGAIAETFSPQEAIRRATRYKSEIFYDENAQSPFFRYVDESGQAHEVWFEDARSARAKFNLAKEYNLRGISYWALGYPFPQNWALLNDYFDIIKLNR